MTDSRASLPPRPDSEIDVGPRGDALEACVDSRVREELGRATRTLSELREELEAVATREPSPDPIIGARVARVRARRIEAIEGSVAVAMALAERTGDELRRELEEAVGGLLEQLEAVSRAARDAAAARPHEQRRVDARFDEVHRRIDAVTRELRAGVTSLAGSVVPSPYGERLADTIGRRLEQLEGEVAVWSQATERTRAELGEELGTLRADAHGRGTGVLRMLEELSRRLERLERRAAEPAAASTGPLLARIEELERDRAAMTARLLDDADAWADERAALHERVAELAARIVTGPVPTGTTGYPDGDDLDEMPFARGLDQLRIGVEGLRMRLAYHEKTVAELAGGRGVDARIDEVRRLLARLETAGAQTSGERDAALDRVEQIAARLDQRLQTLETPVSESRLG